MSYKRQTDGRPPLPSDGHLEDFTTPFLIVAGVLCFIGLAALWAIWGLPVAVICAVLIDRAIPRR